LKKQGFLDLRNYIISNRIGEVDIIGGSHSGFSVAWMLLNGSAMFNYEFEEECPELPESVRHFSDSHPIGSEFYYNEWRVKPIFEEIDFTLQINIIFWDRIWVYYKSVQAAKDEGYEDYEYSGVTKKGVVYPFTGLWGDAKNLWKTLKIFKNEKRVWLLKLRTIAEQASYFWTSKCVVWACGYQSNMIPCINKDGTLIEFK